MLVDLRQHVVQAVAEFVKQRGHIIMRQQCRLATDAVGKIAHQMGNRRLQLAGVGTQPAGAHIVHPGTTALAGTGRLVKVELSHQLAIALDAVKRHTGFPHGR